MNSKSAPNSFVQMIKKKFRFLTNSTNQSGSQGNSSQSSSSSSNNSSRDETTSDDSEKSNSIDFRTKQSFLQLAEQPLSIQNPNMMHRSITDTINTSSSYMNVSNPQQNQSNYLNRQHENSLNITGNMSTSTTLRDLEAVSSHTPNSGLGLPSYLSRRMSTAVNDDDVAHIFNRNSLNDCLYPPSSRRSIAVTTPGNHHNQHQSSSVCQRADYVCVGGSYRLFAATPSPTTPVNPTNAMKMMMMMNSNLQNPPQPKRPSCLQLNNQFKKETSI